MRSLTGAVDWYPMDTPFIQISAVQDLVAHKHCSGTIGEVTL